MIGRCSALLAAVVFLTACSGPGYYLQAISGQWKLVHERQDIHTLLNSPATSPELLKHLETAERIIAFAETFLYLPSGGSYTHYVEVDGDALIWNVVATGEFSLQPKKWCFLVAGCVPYRGYFERQSAEKSAGRLQKKGLDVFVSPAAAYSSLGWFNDPLLSTMFGPSNLRLAAYLFHELAHQRLYVKGDGGFNEGYASFVEEAGLKIWLESNNRQDELQHWQLLQSIGKDFGNLVKPVREELSGLYRSDIPNDLKRTRKAEIFRAFLSAMERLRAEKWGGKSYYSSWFEGPLNNARLALYNTYEGSHCAFRALWDEAAEDMQEFQRLAEQKARLPDEKRRKWLMQSCPGVAQQGKL